EGLAIEDAEIQADLPEAALCGDFPQHVRELLARDHVLAQQHLAEPILRMVAAGVREGALIEGELERGAVAGEDVEIALPPSFPDDLDDLKEAHRVDDLAGHVHEI